MQKAIVIGVGKNKEKLLEEMEELKALCVSCDIETVASEIQISEEINNKTYVGKGKLNDIKNIIDAADLDLAVFNDELTPSQINNIKKVLDITVYDRTFIILEIFKRRAVTKEAILQVDIASLRYFSPRLIGLRSNLSRQRGTGSGGAHGRGQGETKLELDRRNISDRISLLKSELKELTKERSLQRKKRNESNIPIVSLVGYTNSGKSSTLNAIMNYSINVKKNVVAQDMLFATLETASRAIKLENKREFILTDTVGFVSKLPHTLIEAFKSTLEEITEADLIIHVVDAANPEYLAQIETTNEVLKEIGVENIPIIYAFNKIDKLENYFYIPPQFENCVRISAKNNKNIDTLIEAVEAELFKNEIQCEFLIPYNDGNIINILKEQAQINSMSYQNDGTFIKASTNPIIREKLKKYIIKKEENL